MAHPFFEVTRYPANRPEAIELLRVLVDLYDTSQKLTDIYTQFGGDVADLSVQGTLRNLWNEALRNLTKSQPALRNLCDFVKNKYPANQDVQNVILAVETAIPASEISIISGDVLILDRKPLRVDIDKISPEENTTKVILVRGQKKSGKSHCHYLFERLARENGAVPVYLSSDLISTLDPELLNELFSPFGKDAKPPPKDSSPSAWYKSVCTSLQ
ncbi:MAG: effector-associated domain EAD1-containing protein, partial [Chitinophagaceae bacterium]